MSERSEPAFILVPPPTGVCVRVEAEGRPTAASASERGQPHSPAGKSPKNKPKPHPINTQPTLSHIRPLTPAHVLARALVIGTSSREPKCESKCGPERHLYEIPSFLDLPSPKVNYESRFFVSKDGGFLTK